MLIGNHGGVFEEKSVASLRASATRPAFVYARQRINAEARRTQRSGSEFVRRVKAGNVQKAAHPGFGMRRLRPPPSRGVRTESPLPARGRLDRKSTRLN